MLQIDTRILMGMVKHSQGPQKNKFLMSLQYLKKKKKNIATVFVCYCDAKQSDILRGSSQVHCNLFLGSCGQKWVQPFRSWNSKISYIFLENELMKWVDLLHADTNLGKLNVNLILYWVGILKNGWDLLDQGTLKSGVSHKWFDESSRLIQWFLQTDFWFNH